MSQNGLKGYSVINATVKMDAEHINTLPSTIRQISFLVGDLLI